jgi:hypothetical protein
MSNILRRPMFRMGGQVNSQGTGIMSGLEPRMNYQAGGPALSYEDQLKKETRDYKRIQELSKYPFKTAEEFGKEYDTYVESLDPTMLMGIDEFGPGTYGESLEEKKRIALDPKIKQSFIAEKLAEQQKIIDEAKSLGIKSELLSKIPEKEKPKVDQNKLLQNLKETEKTEFRKRFEEFLPIFQEQLGPDADEARRQKYMQLAKFGLGLLAQPGGSLVEAIGRAGEKPLAGLETAAAREAEAKKLPKALALEAALKQIEPRTATELGIIASRQAKYAEKSLEQGLTETPGAAAVYAKQIDALVQDPKTRTIAGKFKKKLPDPSVNPQEYQKALPKKGKGYFVNYDGTLTVYNADTKTFYDINEVINDIEFYQE